MIRGWCHGHDRARARSRGGISRRSSDFGGPAGVLPATHFRNSGRKLMLVSNTRWSISSPTAFGSRFKQLARWSAAPDRSRGASQSVFSEVAAGSRQKRVQTKK